MAIARKLLMVVWHVRMAKSADRRADAEQVAFKLMVWAWKLTDEQRGGLIVTAVHPRTPDPLGSGCRVDTHHTRRNEATAGDDRGGVGVAARVAWPTRDCVREKGTMTARFRQWQVYPTGQGQDERAMGHEDGGASRAN